MRRWGILLAGLALLLPVTVTYSNHFHNGFEFDDFHSITDNVFVRSLSNIPRFFVDSTTSSIYPTHQAWRPLVTTSLAIDYWLAKGYSPFYFHLSTFIWFLTLLLFALLLFQSILGDVRLAWFAAALFGLHPAIAETVNYIIQRADLMSTWGIVAGLAIYARFPAWRRWCLYLVPVAIGLLCKPPALIFPALLAAYIFLFGEEASPTSWNRVLRRSIPALALTALFLVLQSRMTPPTFASGYLSASRYLITQPYVWFRYFVSFFLPFHLNADSDLAPLASAFTLEALGGFFFVAALLFSIWLAARSRETRPVAFGLAWFVLGLIPTSVFPLAEVENDHRMFLPFIGLALAATSGAACILQREPSRIIRSVAAVGSICLLLLCAAGTRRRNEVWKTPESLWYDVTLKSPSNGRGLMNYGLARMSAGDFRTALTYFERALQFTPSYPSLEINLGIAYGALGRDADAEQHFRRAVQLEPNNAETHYYYGRWLRTRARDNQAIPELQSAIALSPAGMDARELLLQTYADRGSWALLGPLAIETLKFAPDDPVARRFAAMQPGQIQPAAPVVPAQPTPEALLDASLTAYQRRDFEGCIRLAQMALKLRPNYAEAYNNIIAANNSLSRWDDAILAGHEALRIRPDYELARNNLAWAESQKRLAGQSR